MTVLKKRTKSAIGLAYQEAGRDSAPQISVHGEQILADEIVRIAKRFNVPIVEDAHLAQALGKLNVDTEIPEELYESVAVILKVLGTTARPTSLGSMPKVLNLKKV